MKILAYNSGHDGAIALLENERLLSCIEVEKDNGPRHGIVGLRTLYERISGTNELDVLAVSGWSERRRGMNERNDPGYFGSGADAFNDGETTLLKRRLRRFATSHERSHILCSYGLSPFPQGQPCYALVWEGNIGRFYYIDEKLQVEAFPSVMGEPGNKYAFLYSLADPSVPLDSQEVRLDDAGKLMALAAYGATRPAQPIEQEILDRVLNLEGIYGKEHKRALADSMFCNVGVESQSFKDLARQLSDRLFDEFLRYAKYIVKRKLPLLISGGCGLNCEWNSRWQQCGLFSDVFVPPCANDSGVALGAAIDAQHRYTGNAKISWSVYAGEPFLHDVTVDDMTIRPLNLQGICRDMREGAVIGWVQGRYEIGPRALGNRSILAAPFRAESREKLNRIKQRENFRPIAPVCREEELRTHFEALEPSPYMLHFQRVKSSELGAVTHVDGSARAQSVSAAQNSPLHALLSEFSTQTSYGVLCNTSLNFKGRGFINRMGDLLRYTREHQLDGFVVDDKYYTPPKTRRTMA